MCVGDMRSVSVSGAVLSIASDDCQSVSNAGLTINWNHVAIKRFTRANEQAESKNWSRASERATATIVVTCRQTL